MPEAFLEPVADPLGDLVARYARTHGPFTAADVRRPARASAPAVVGQALRRLAAQRPRASSGEFRPGGAGTEWCDAEVLRLLRRRSLAALRREVEPVAPDGARAGSCPPGSGVGGTAARRRRASLRAVEQLQGVAVPASALERWSCPPGSPTTPRPCSTS